MLTFEYTPSPDGDPDPGEVVWTWVAYEDDPTQGKDRPVLLIARDRTDDGVAPQPTPGEDPEADDYLWGLYLTSKDHDRDAAQEARAGRYWADIGTGGWDREGRPSEVRLNRLIAVNPNRVRREGDAVAAEVFARVVEAAQPYLTDLIAKRGHAGR